MHLHITTIAATCDPPQGAVVLLHGWGGNVQDLAAIAQYLCLPQLQYYLPSAPFPHPYNPVGRMWYSFPNNYQFSPEDPFQPGDDLTTSRHLLTDWLQTLPEKAGVPLSRTLLAGFSQGGAMTLDVGLALPLAGLLVMSGFLHTVPAGDRQPKAPILMVHGRQDAVVPLAVARYARDCMQSLGATLAYQELDIGHEIDPEALQLMRQFIQDRLDL